MYTFSFPPFFPFLWFTVAKMRLHAALVANFKSGISSSFFEQRDFFFFFLSRGISSNWDRNEIIVTVTTDEC